MLFVTNWNIISSEKRRRSQQVQRVKVAWHSICGSVWRRVAHRRRRSASLPHPPLKKPAPPTLAWPEPAKPDPAGRYYSQGLFKRLHDHLDQSADEYASL